MIDKIRKKIRDFFLTSLPLRQLRSFIHNSLFPNAIRGSWIFLVIIIFIITTSWLFKPDYISKAYKKTSFYFFHYLNLDNYRFSEINIEGNFHVSDEDIIRVVNEVETSADNDIDSDGSRFFIKNLVQKIKLTLPWVDQVRVTRTMPNILNIAISEYEPFAIWQNEVGKYLSDKDGNLVPYEDLKEFENMVILSGEDANVNAKSLFNIFATDPHLSANVYSATWVSNRRWDIRFENALLIKLPATNIADAWQRLINIYNKPGSIIGLKVIDLRISDKVYLEYNDSVIKELKNL